MPILVFFVSLWYLSLFCQTFFQHRYGAHGAFKMSKGWERFFFILTWVTQGSSYLSPRAYAIMHRMHHAYTDTEEDPHSPSFSKNVFTMMWQTKDVYSSIFLKQMDVEDRFVKNIPEWGWFDRFAHSYFSRFLFIAAYTAFFIHFAGASWGWYLLLPIVFVMGPFHGAIINWYAHRYGHVDYEMENTSKNMLHVDFLMLGESYHNNHHKFPSSVNFGRRWYEVDPVYPVIRLLAWLKVIRINKPVPAPAHRAKREPAELM